MKKKLSINLLFIILVSIIIYKNSGISLEEANSYTVCGGVSVPTGILKLSSIAVKLMQIFVPIGMIIFGSIDFIKAIVSFKNDELEKRKKIFLKRMIIGCMSFFVFTIVKAVAGLTEDKDKNYTSCLACAIKGTSCGGEVSAPFDYEYPKQVSIYDSSVGFVQPTLNKDAYEDKNNNSSSSGDSVTGYGSADELIKYGKKYLGLVYVYGGSSLQSGVDCSGYTQQVFKKFGVELPRSADEQSKMGTKVSNLKEAKPGDLLFFDWNNDGHMDHVSIYLGNNEKMHASGRPSCNGKTANGCQVKIDTNSLNQVKIIKRIKLG